MTTNNKIKTLEQSTFIDILEGTKTGRNVLAILDSMVERETLLKLSNEEITRAYMMGADDLISSPEKIYHLIHCLLRAGDVALMSGKEIKTLRLRMTLDQGETILGNLQKSYEFDARTGTLSVIFHEHMEVKTVETKEHVSVLGE